MRDSIIPQLSLQNRTILFPRCRRFTNGRAKRLIYTAEVLRAAAEMLDVQGERLGAHLLYEQASHLHQRLQTLK